MRAALESVPKAFPSSCASGIFVFTCAGVRSRAADNEVLFLVSATTLLAYSARDGSLLRRAEPFKPLMVSVASVLPLRDGRELLVATRRAVVAGSNACGDLTVPMLLLVDAATLEPLRRVCPKVSVDRGRVVLSPQASLSRVLDWPVLSCRVGSGHERSAARPGASQQGALALSRVATLIGSSVSQFGSLI